MKHRPPLLAAALAAALFLDACRAGSYQTRPLPSQSVEVSRPDVARVYMMREGQLRGKIRDVRVEDADQDIGILDQGEFLCWERPPGRTLLTVVFESGVMEGGGHEALFSLDAEPGRAYYLLIHVDPHSD